MAKTGELARWQRTAALIVGAWVPPARTPLRVEVWLYLPRESLRRTDIDGYQKAILDVVVGARRDQWIDQLTVHKLPGDGTVLVNVEIVAKGEA